jgi:hypothetical protein
MALVTVAVLLHEAAETHRRLQDRRRRRSGWASWSADWLLNLFELPELRGRKPVRGHLVHALVQLDREYTKSGDSERWEDWYASRLESVLP